MQLEDYFLFEKFDTKFGPVERIRIKGHRISLENVLEYFNKGVTPEQIQREVYPSLTLEEVYATITYYLRNKAQVEEYVRAGEAVADAYYQEHLQREPDEVTKRLRALKAKQEENRTADGEPKLPV
jgi:uncharacterized protein (DUF433 family)